MPLQGVLSTRRTLAFLLCRSTAALGCAHKSLSCLNRRTACNRQLTTNATRPYSEKPQKEPQTGRIEYGGHPQDYSVRDHRLKQAAMDVSEPNMVQEPSPGCKE